MIVAQADLITVDKDQKALVDLANKTALQIDLVRSYIPAGSVLLGLILLFVGGFLGLARREPPPIEAPRRPDGKFGDMTPPGPPRPPRPPAAPAPAPDPAPPARRPAPGSQRQRRKAAGPSRRR
jgi:hypothetical protein